MLVQGAFVASVLLGLGLTCFSSSTNDQAIFWRSLRSIVLEIGLPSILMGCSFPLANAVVQHAETWVGRRAGGLYLANTAGAVLGSLVAGYVLLPALGMQSAAAVLAIVAAFAIGCFMAGLGGAIIVPIQTAVLDMGIDALILAFVVVVIGGLGSLQGALVGALIVAIVRTAGIQFFPEIELAVLYLIAAIVLLVKPTGLFGTA